MSKIPFVDLLNKPGDLRRVYEHVEQTIWDSFADDRRRASADTLIVTPNSRQRITQAETRRRFGICEKWFRIMRGDLRFGLTKTLDLLPQALRSELDGTKFEPQAGAWGSQEFAPQFMTEEEKRAAREILQRRGVVR